MKSIDIAMPPPVHRPQERSGYSRGGLRIPVKATMLSGAWRPCLSGRPASNRHGLGDEDVTGTGRTRVGEAELRGALGVRSFGCVPHVNVAGFCPRSGAPCCVLTTQSTPRSGAGRGFSVRVFSRLVPIGWWCRYIGRQSLIDHSSQFGSTSGANGSPYFARWRRQ